MQFAATVLKESNELSGSDVVSTTYKYSPREEAGLHIHQSCSFGMILASIP